MRGTYSSFWPFFFLLAPLTFICCRFIWTRISAGLRSIRLQRVFNQDLSTFFGWCLELKRLAWSLLYLKGLKTTFHSNNTLKIKNCKAFSIASLDELVNKGTVIVILCLEYSVKFLTKPMWCFVSFMHLSLIWIHVYIWIHFAAFKVCFLGRINAQTGDPPADLHVKRCRGDYEAGWRRERSVSSDVTVLMCSRCFCQVCLTSFTPALPVAALKGK